jgi:predicted outer membrane repeat protein
LIHNSIVAGNTSPLGPDFKAPANAINLDVRSSLIGNNSQTTLAAGLPDGNGNFVGSTVSPLSSGLRPLAANGGPTETHALLNGGLAVNSGDNALALDFGSDGAPGGQGIAKDVALFSDQRGGLFTRFANGPTTDIGAFELQPPPTLIVDTNADVVNGNFAPGDRSLRELIELANTSAGLDTILFSAGFPSTITLDPALGPLVISDSVSILGPRVGQLSIQKDPAEVFRLLDITSTANNVVISDLSFTGGNAGAEDGGAIRSQSTGNLVIVRSQLDNNSAASGGAIATTGGTVSIAASTLAGNTATSNGGGIAAISAAASLVLVDSTVSSNVATLAGGGIYSENADVNVANSTVTLNTAGTDGGGIGLLANGGGESLNIDNSIVAGNTANIAHDFNAPLGADDLDVDFSLIGDNNGTTLTESTVINSLPDPDASGNLIGGGSNPAIDPMLGALASNGGPTMTHNLLEGSLAIDAGNALLLPKDTFDLDGDNRQDEESLPVDQRGAKRVVDSLDMGAVELAAVPVIIWNNPADISFGTLLSATQLNATTTAIGTFSYTPDIGTELLAGDNQVLSVLFTPSNPLAFRPVTETVLIDVNKADPVVTWSDPAAIDYLTPLSSTQLDATADVLGTFVYTPAAPTVLNAGSQTLSVTFTPDDSANYNEVIQTATLVVNKIDPVVTWSDPAAIDYLTPLSSTQLNAMADIDGTFVYDPVDGTVLDAGNQTLSVTFTPNVNDAANFNEVTQTAMLVVNPIDPAVTWSDPAGITFGTALDATQLNATADVPGNYVYTPASGTELDAGLDQVLSVTFTPVSSNYNPITRQVMIDVAKADPVITWMNPDDIAAGTPLSSTQLDATVSGVTGTFVYDPAAGTVLDPGDNQPLSVTFTPAAPDDANYNVATAMVSINVIQAPQDFGDAPSQYPVLLADNGARHATTGAISLGTNVDSEVDGQPSAGADGDGADDDGVFVIADAVAVSDADTKSSFTVIASGSGRLDAWIDFNGNGDWSDPREQIATSAVVTAGSNTISYTIPSGASAGSTAARFRISTAGGLAPTGEAPDGEVEDYIVSLLDGSAAPDASVTLPANSAVIQIDSTGISVNQGTSVLFSAPESALGSLDVQGGDDDDTITLDFDDGPSGGLTLDGAAGENTLNVTGATIDLTSTGLVSAQNFGSIDMSDSTQSVITIDAATVAALSPFDKTIFIVGGEKDVLDFKNPADWRLTEPIVNGQFVLTITNQVTGEVVQFSSAAPWQNPIQPSDVNNSGTVTVGDALVIVNELARRAFSSDTNPQPLNDPFTADPWPGNYYDQDGNGNATALDALRVINEIARDSSGGGAGEGEISIAQLLRTLSTNEASVPDQQPSLVAGASKVKGFERAAANSIESSPTAESPTTKSEQVWSERVDQLLSDESSLEGLS